MLNVTSRHVNNYWWEKVVYIILLMQVYRELFYTHNAAERASIIMVIKRLADQFRQQWSNGLQIATSKGGESGNKLNF